MNLELTIIKELAQLATSWLRHSPVRRGGLRVTPGCETRGCGMRAHLDVDLVELHERLELRLALLFRAAVLALVAVGCRCCCG